MKLGVSTAGLEPRPPGVPLAYDSFFFFLVTHCAITRIIPLLAYKQQCYKNMSQAILHIKYLYTSSIYDALDITTI